MKISWGFSLIELTIAIAVLSILSAILLPFYMGYTASAKIAAGVSELDALKVSYESTVSIENRYPNLSDLGITSGSSNCTFSVSNNQDGSGKISCALVNPPYLIHGGVVSVARSAAGNWSCEVNASVSASYSPKGCTVGN